MTDTTHEGNDPMGALTTPRGPLEACPAPECQDRVIEQQEDAEPTATVAGQSIALHVTGYPDVPNRWGSGRVRVTGLRLDYGNHHTPNGRHAFVTGLWIRENGEVTNQPIDQYYDAPTGDTSTWPEWIADLALKHTPTDRAAVLREAAAAIETEQDREEATELARFGELDHETELGRGYVLASAALLRRLADQAQQPETEEPAPLTPCTCRQAVHALEHHGRTIPNCPWCTPAPNIRPNQPAGRTVNTVDTRLLGTKET